MNLAIIGNIAFDIIEQPNQKIVNLGGAAFYAGVSASLFQNVAVVGNVGEDFPLGQLKKFDIDLRFIKQWPNQKTTKFTTRFLSSDGQQRIIEDNINQLLIPTKQQLTKEILQAKYIHKCITLCRDVYETQNSKGNFLYVPDLDYIDKLETLNIDSIKLEGRRRSKQELDAVIKQIKNRNKKNFCNGYLLSVSNKQNNLFEKVNRRTKVHYQAKDAKYKIGKEDVFVVRQNNVSTEFSTTVEAEHYYCYSQITSDFNPNLFNISLHVKSNQEGQIQQIMLLNHKGEAKYFNSQEGQIQVVDFHVLKRQIQRISKNICLYRIFFTKPISGVLTIHSKMKQDLLEFLKKTYKKSRIKKRLSTPPIHNLIVETNKMNIAKKLVDQNITTIFAMQSIVDFKMIEKYTDVLKDKVIYKLPIFNFLSEDLKPYLQHLQCSRFCFNQIATGKTKTLHQIFIWILV